MRVRWIRDEDQLTLSLIGKELVDLSNSSVVGTHHKAMVVHVQNDVLALCGNASMRERKHWNQENERERRLKQASGATIAGKR